MFCSTPTRDAERVVDRRHPLGVAAGEVVVDRDDVDALAGQRVEDDGERRGERLALAGLHLGDVAAVQDHPADELDVEVAHAHRAPAGLADDREGLGQQLVERLAVARALAQLVHARAQLLVGLSSSSSGSKSPIRATRFSYSRNCLDSPMFSARSRRPMDPA